MTIRRIPKVEAIEEGWKKAKVKNVREGSPVMTAYGETDTALVTFEMPTGHIVTQSVLLFFGNNSIFEKLVNATLGEEVDEVNLPDLIGHSCEIEIKHKHVGEKTYSNVMDVRTLETKSISLDSKIEKLSEMFGEVLE